MKTVDTIEVFMNRLTEAQSELLRYVAGVLVLFPDDVEDVVQDVNYALISHAKDYRVDSPFLPWAIVYAKNQIRVFYRKQKQEKLIFDNDLLDLYEKSAFAEEPEQEKGTQRRKNLSICLARLDAGQRRLIEQHYFLKKTLREIARDDRANESTLHVTAFRARKFLADCIKRLCRLGGDSKDNEEGITPFDKLTAQVIDDQDKDCAFHLFTQLHDNPAGMGIYAEQLEIDLL